MTVVASGSGRLEAIPRPRSVFQRNVNLVRELSITQFKLKYTGSALGYVWSLVKPLMLFGIMYLVFSVLLKAAGTARLDRLSRAAAARRSCSGPSSSSPPRSAMNAIAGAGDLIRKAYFPALDPRRRVDHERGIAHVRDQHGARHRRDVRARASRPHLAEPARAALLRRARRARPRAVAVAVALFVFFRDLGHIWEILSLVLFYGSAVVFPFSHAIPEALRGIAGLNPIAQIVQDLRHALVVIRPWTSTPIPSMASHAIGPLVVIPILRHAGRLRRSASSSSTGSRRSSRRRCEHRSSRSPISASDFAFRSTRARRSSTG